MLLEQLSICDFTVAIKQKLIRSLKLVLFTQTFFFELIQFIDYLFAFFCLIVCLDIQTNCSVMAHWYGLQSRTFRDVRFMPWLYVWNLYICTYSCWFPSTIQKPAVK